MHAWGLAGARCFRSLMEFPHFRHARKDADLGFSDMHCFVGIYVLLLLCSHSASSQACCLLQLTSIIFSAACTNCAT
jgi:hypothetical protein